MGTRRSLRRKLTWWGKMAIAILADGSAIPGFIAIGWANGESLVLKPAASRTTTKRTTRRTTRNRIAVPPGVEEAVTLVRNFISLGRRGKREVAYREPLSHSSQQMTLISCHAVLERSACAPFIKE